MQAIKEKLSDMSAMRKAKNEAKEEEKEEKELAKARVEVAKEVRLAREAEAAMDLHVNKAADKVVQQEHKHPHSHHGGSGRDTIGDENYTQQIDHSYSAGRNPTTSPAATGFTTDPAYGGASDDAYAYGADSGSAGSAGIAGTTGGYAGNRSGGSAANNNLL